LKKRKFFALLLKKSGIFATLFVFMNLNFVYFDDVEV